MFALSVQSRCLDGSDPVELRIRDAIGTNIDKKANELVIGQFGKVEGQGEGYELTTRFS